MRRPASEQAWRHVRRRWLRGLALTVSVVIVIVGLDQTARIWAEQRALARLRNDAEATTSQRVAVLQSEIEKQRSLPFVLARDSDVQRALTSDDPSMIAKLNQKLATLSVGTRAGVIYLIDRNGLTIAASNFDTPTSFAGNNYAFRPYFRLAMEKGSAEEFAFGNVSLKPGLYLSRRVDDSSGALGVIVVKVEFEAIEQQWQRFTERIFVTGDHGIVLVSSRPEWHFMSIAPLSQQRQIEIRDSLQFGNAMLEPLPLKRGNRDTQGIVSVRVSGEKQPIDFVEVEAPVPTTNWTLHLLAPTRSAVIFATTASRSLALLGGIVIIGGISLWWTRRRSQQRQRARAEATRCELEERVQQRTAELQNANTRLHLEMDERRRAETTLHELQDDLVQANKLAVLGQIAASVAHEINQPVSAIRTFADNGCTLLARNDLDQLRGNLGTIAGLTDRIGSITGQLRAFARKSPSKIEAVSLRSTVDGALLLVGHRLRQRAIDFELDIFAGDVIVAVDRARLEQVFVNLLQNAVEALADHPRPQIRIKAASTGDDVSVVVSDNGPGLPDMVMQSLFVPFTTTKAAGLGLGLVISKDILREFGGSFSASNSGAGGAVLTLTIPRYL